MTSIGRTKWRYNTEGSHTVSREEIVIEDIHAKIQRYNVPLAIRMSKPRASRIEGQNMNLDFIGNCPKWCDQTLIGLFGPDLAFADVVLLGHIPELRKEIPETLVKRFKNGVSDAEVAFYHYRYHLASVRHKSDVRTARSQRNRRKQIYPFVVGEYPKDPTNKLLTLTLDHPSIKLRETQLCGQPNVTLLFELITALDAWAFQTDHAIAPSQSILKILLETQGTESEFDYIRGRLAEQNMIIYAPEDAMEQARGWVGGELSFIVVDDLWSFEDEVERMECSMASSVQISTYADQSLGGLHHPLSNNNSHFSCRSTVDTRECPSNNESSRQLSNRLSDRSRRKIYELDATTSMSRATSNFLTKSWTTQIMNTPAEAGGTKNHSIKMDREFDLHLRSTMTPNDVAFENPGVDNSLHNGRALEQEKAVTILPIIPSITSEELEKTISDHEVQRNCCKVS